MVLNEKLNIITAIIFHPEGGHGYLCQISCQSIIKRWLQGATKWRFRGSTVSRFEQNFNSGNKDHASNSSHKELKNEETPTQSFNSLLVPFHLHATSLHRFTSHPLTLIPHPSIHPPLNPSIFIPSSLIPPTVPSSTICKKLHIYEAVVFVSEFILLFTQN